VLVALVLLTVGAVLLVAGAEAFAEHVQAAGARLGVHVAALALLVAGAEPEEAIVASLAAYRDRPDLAVGDALGANLVIATLTLGLAALVAPWPVTRTIRRYAGAAGVAAVLACLALLGGGVSRIEGTLLLGAYAGAVLVVWRTSRQVPVVGELAELAEKDASVPPDGKAVAMVALGLVAMAAGGVLAVAGATRVVAVTGLADSAVGLTVLALATSAEMLALVWAAHRRALSEVAVAGALGAVAYNATMTLGVAALVAPLQVGDVAPLLSYGLVGAVVPLLVAASLRERVGRLEGTALVGCYLLATLLVFAPLG